MKSQPILTRVLVVLLVLTCLYAGPIRAVYAATIVVNTTDDELNSDGDCSLREAIQAANTDTAVDGCSAGSGADTIILPIGLHTLAVPGADEEGNATGDLDVTDDLTINGGGTTTTVIQAGTSSINGIDRVLDVYSGVTVEVNHLWIRHGRTPTIAGEEDGGGIRTDTTSMLILNNSYVGSNTADWRGGGIYSRGTLTLDDSIVGFNTADSIGSGGGIYNVGGTLTLTNSTVANNHALYSGGGVYNYSGTLTLNDSTVANNAAETTHGGGIYNYSGTLTLNNTTVSTNTAGVHGGGILNGGTLTLNSATVADNTADSDHDVSGNGGGIWNDAWLILKNSTVADNTAIYGGGIYNDGDNTVLLSKSTVADNDCGYSGGGIYNDNSLATVRLLKSTVNGNDAGMGHGGGICNSGGDLSLDNCTVSGNTSGQSGGGIYTGGSLWLEFTTVASNTADRDADASGDGGGVYVSGGTAQTRNTIIGDNQDWQSHAPDCWGTLTSEGYNLLEDTAGCTFTPTTGDITGWDPNLGSLGDNGGPTWTHALQSTSRAIEEIDDGTSGCQAGGSVDQRGYVRAGGPGYGGSRCDIGACEYDTGPRVVRFLTGSYNWNELGGTATITVVLGPASGDTVTVDYATSDGTATGGSDYTGVSGTVTFNPGVTVRSFTVPILDDTLDEADETVTLTLSNPTGAIIGGTNPATLNIVDDDPLPTVRFSAPTYTANEGAGSATITVNLSAPSGRLVEVDCATSDGTATAGSDYIASGATVYFYPGDTSKTFTVNITDDALEEADETIILTLSDAANATIGGTNPAMLTIVDNDGADLFIYLPLALRNS
jgi:CSLREA domain-containing protein